MSVEIAPSVLSADPLRLGAQVEEVLATGCRRLHVDVTDGHFVPSLTLGTPVVEALAPLAARAGAVLEVHLMIEEPDRHLDAFHRAGAGAMTVHVEACRHVHRTVAAIRGLGASPGVGLSPATPIGALEEIAPEIDVALVMAVDPGYGGQRFIEASVDKVARLRASLRARGLDRVDIEVDGGVGPQNAGRLAAAGMTIAVAGTAIFRKGTVGENVRVLRAACGALRG
jgi:ribulose-phosphate 3-epimerase